MLISEARCELALSEYDKKVLEQLERDLLGSDDSLARKFGKDSVPKSNSAAKLIAGALIALVGMSLVIFAAIAHVVAFGVAGFLVALAGVLVASANNTTRGKKAGNTTPKTSKSGSFFEDRWEKRRDQS
jgi:hypothetical protein